MKITLESLKSIVRETAGEAVAEQMEAARKRGLDRKHMPGILGGGSDPEPSDKKEKGSKDTNVGAAIRFLAKAKGDYDKASQFAEREGYLAVSKALSASDFTDGGALLKAEMVDGIIPLLEAISVVRGMGVTVLPMKGSLTLPFQTTGATAAYVGENQAIAASQPSFGQLQLSDKKLAALVAVSNDLLRNAGPKVDALIQQDAAKKVALRQDLAFMRGIGSSGEPKGMELWADSANKFNANTTVTAATVTEELGRAVQKLEEANVLITKGGWLISPRTKKYLMTARDGNNNLIWEPEMKNGTLMGFPFKVSTQIPNNLGGSSIDSKVYFANFADLIIGENEDLIIDVFPGGTYDSGGGTMISGVSSDQTVVRVISLHDFGASFRGKEIALIETVRWGN